MYADIQPGFLLASHAPACIAAIELSLRTSGINVTLVSSAQAALEAMLSRQTLVLLDAALPGMDLDQLLATVHAKAERRRFPIVLISDTLTQPWLDRLTQGVIDDLISRAAAQSPCLPLRLDMVLRAFRSARELEQLRETVALSSQIDPVTGIYNRTTMVSMLFRETDRAQRMKTSLSLILFELDDFEHWNSQLGPTACEDLLVEVVARMQRLLRSYDLFGRMGKVQFLLGLPGCTAVNAAMFAERARLDAFAEPFAAGGRTIRLSACFGLVTNQGRSPLVSLREAENALELAQAAGPESIETAGDRLKTATSPIAFLSPIPGDDLVDW